MGLRNLPLPGSQRETCELKCPKHSVIFTALCGHTLGYSPEAFSSRGTYTPFWGSPAGPSSNKRGRASEPTAGRAGGRGNTQTKPARSQEPGSGLGLGQPALSCQVQVEGEMLLAAWQGMQGLDFGPTQGQWETSPHTH